MIGTAAAFYFDIYFASNPDCERRHLPSEYGFKSNLFLSSLSADKLSPMPRHDGLGDGQAQTEAVVFVPCRICLVKAVKHTSSVQGFYPGEGVKNSEDHPNVIKLRKSSKLWAIIKFRY